MVQFRRAPKDTLCERTPTEDEWEVNSMIYNQGDSPGGSEGLIQLERWSVGTIRRVGKRKEEDNHQSKNLKQIDETFEELRPYHG